MNNILFYLKLGYRNLVRGKIKTLLLSVSLFIGLTVVLIFANVFPMVKSAFIGQALNQYGDMDVYVTYDANSSSRFLTQRTLLDQFASEIDFVAPFFNFFGVIEFEDELQYTHVLSSNSNGQTFLGLEESITLRPDEAIITKSFSETWNLAINDAFFLTIGTNKYLFTIREILPDYAIFSKDSIFIDKQSLLEKIIELPILDNIGNTLYIRLNHSQSEDFVSRLNSSNLYSGFVINEVLNDTEITQSATYTASILMAMCLFGILALGYVIHSFVPLFYREFAEQVGVIQSLGGHQKITIRIWLIQFVLLFAFLIPFAILTTNLIFQEGLRQYQVALHVALDGSLSVIGIFAFLLFILFDMSLQIRPLIQSSAIRQVSDKRNLMVHVRWTTPLVSVLFMILSLTPFFSEGWNALLQIGFVIMIVLWLIDSIFHLWNRVIKQRVRYSEIISIPLLAKSKAYHTAMKISVLSIMVLILSFSSRSFLRNSFPLLQEQIQIDYLLVNLFNYQSSTLEEISHHPEVQRVDEAIYHQYIIIDPVDKPKRMAFHLSMEYAQLSHYFSFPIQGGNVELLMSNPNQLAILLPYSLAKSHNKTIGDEILVDFPHPIGRKSCFVAGLIETEYDNIMFTNLFINQSDSFQQSINALTVIRSGHDTFEQDMIRQYGAQMMGVVSIERLLVSLRDPIFALFDFVMFIIMIIVIAFGFVVWMNALMVYQQFKGLYAVMISMGLSKQRLTRFQILEFGYMSLFIIVSVLMIWLFAFPKIPDLLLLVGYYKVIPATLLHISIAILRGTGMYFLGFGYCLFLLRKLDVIQTLKLS